MRPGIHRAWRQLAAMGCFLIWSGAMLAQRDNNNNTIPQQNQQRYQNTLQQQKSPVQNSESNFNSLFQKKNDFSFNNVSYLDSASYYATRAPLKAMDYINKAIAQSVREEDRATESASYLVLGNIQQGLGQHELAIENYLKCFQVGPSKSKFRTSAGKSIGPETAFEANKHLATSYLELGQLDNADQRIGYCLAYLSMPAGEVQAVRRIQASIRQKQGRVQDAIAILNEVAVQEKQNGNAGGEAETYIALAGIFLEQKNDEKAIDLLNRAKELAERNNLSAPALKANDLLATIFRRQKNLAKELEVRNNKISINTSFNNKQAVMKENIEIGNAYLSANQMENAQAYYDIGLNEFSQQGTEQRIDKQLFPESDNLDEMAGTYKRLAEQYLKQKNPAKALVYFDKYAQLQDSIRHVRQRELDQALSISNTLGKNQQRIDLLEKERQLAGQSMDILRRDKDLQEKQIGFKNTIIGVLIFFILSMLMAGFFVIRSSREKRRVNQLLALKSLRGQMNPHFIFNALNSVNHYISQNDERKANRYLSDFSKLMRMVMDSSKHSLVTLSEELDMLRLYLQLEHTRFSDKFAYSIEVDDSLSERDFELPPMLIQPYLENAVWHGLRYLDQQGSLSLLIAAREGELIVTITDDGIGREKSRALKTSNQKKQASIGMQNIENRIVIMNDLFRTNIRVEVADAYPGREHCGTRVILHIPQQH